MDHSHVMGGSTATQRRNCPASLNLEKEMPPQPESEYAARGSMLHAAMELLVIAQPETVKAAEPLLRDLIGQDMGYEGFEITQDLIDSKIRPALGAWLEIVETYDIDDWFIEEKVSLQALIPGAFGTPDVIAKDKAGRFHDLDWKFGDGYVVDVVANDAAAFYTSCAKYSEDPEIREFFGEPTGYVFHIVQPRIGGESVYKSWETTDEWLEKWLTQTIDAADAAVRDKPPAKAGAWCKWCRAKPICPVQNAMADDALTKQPSAMTAVELADALKKADLLKAWIGDVFKLAQHELEQGAALPGWKLVQKLPRRTWRDPLAAEAAMKKARIKVADLYKKTLLSPTQLQKLKPKLYSKVESDLVTLHSSGVTVVHDTDKRPALSGGMDLLANALNKTDRKRK